MIKDLEWDVLKEKIFYTNNGVLRNISAYDLDITDWERLIMLFNDRYDVLFRKYDSSTFDKFIMFEEILKFWSGINDDGCMAILKKHEIYINCYFNGPKDLDFDVDCTCINKLEDAEIVIKFLIEISKVINKPVFLETESYSEKTIVLLEVNLDNVVCLI